MASISPIRDLTAYIPSRVDLTLSMVYNAPVVPYDYNVDRSKGDLVYVYSSISNPRITIYRARKDIAAGETTNPYSDIDYWEEYGVINKSDMSGIFETVPESASVGLVAKPIKWDYLDISALVPEADPNRFNWELVTVDGVTTAKLLGPKEDYQRDQDRKMKGSIRIPGRYMGYDVTEVVKLVTGGSAEVELTSIYVPDSVTTLGDNVFYYFHLTSLRLSESLTALPNNMAWGCEIIDLDVPESVISIGSRACECTTVTIHNPSATIADDAFNISKLTTVYGYTGSTAEAYATDHNLTFIAL